MSRPDLRHRDPDAVEALAERISHTATAAGAPIVIGISGFCGSGKSTLARLLASRIPRSARMRGDDFLDPERSHVRSDEWDGVERDRLISTVVRPFREGVDGRFQRFDWSERRLGEPEPLPDADVLIVDAIGLFHPDVRDEFDLTIWCDLDLATAAQRGIARDRSLGRDSETLWTDVWIPNEADFAARFRPRDFADLVYSTV